MNDIFGLDPNTAYLAAAGLLFGLWYVARSPKIQHGNAVPMTVFCLHCNWQGRVPRNAARCGKCHSMNLSVLTA